MFPQSFRQICAIFAFGCKNIGPCAMDEVFFPYTSDSPIGIGSCFAVNTNAKATFDEVEDICLSSYGKGSKRSPFSKRDPEYGLVEAALDFLETRSESKM